jgi:hypothetical protein
VTHQYFETVHVSWFMLEDDGLMPIARLNLGPIA